MSMRVRQGSYDINYVWDMARSLRIQRTATAAYAIHILIGPEKKHHNFIIDFMTSSLRRITYL